MRTVLRGDCREGVTYMALFMGPHEREALSSVRSTAGHLVNDTEAVLPFTGLQWKSGGLTVATLQEAYVLRRIGGRWKIVA